MRRTPGDQRTCGRTSSANRCRSSMVASSRSRSSAGWRRGERRHPDEVVQPGRRVGGDRVDGVLRSVGREEGPQHRHHELVGIPTDPLQLTADRRHLGRDLLRRRADGVVAGPVPRHAPVCGRRLATDPDRDVRLLDGSRVGADVAVAHPAAVEAARPVLRPQVDARGHVLVGHGAPAVVQLADPERVELLAHPPDADAERDAPVRDPVDRRQLLREDERVAVGHDEHARTDQHTLRAGGDRRHHGDRVVDELLGTERRIAGGVVEVARRDAARHDHVVVDPDRVVAERLGRVGDREAAVHPRVLAERAEVADQRTDLHGSATYLRREDRARAVRRGRPGVARRRAAARRASAPSRPARHPPPRSARVARSRRRAAAPSSCRR